MVIFVDIMIHDIILEFQKSQGGRMSLQLSRISQASRESGAYSAKSDKSFKPPSPEKSQADQSQPTSLGDSRVDGHIVTEPTGSSGDGSRPAWRERLNKRREEQQPIPKVEEEPPVDPRQALRDRLNRRFQEEKSKSKEDT